MSALADGLATMVGAVPPLAVIGAVHTLSWVPSEAVALVTSVNVSPAESVTLEVVAWPELQSATSTTSRFPLLTADGMVTDRLVCPEPCALACCTNAGAAAAVGVTACDGVDAGPVPTALLAETVKVYELPLVRPVTVAVVAGGLPATWVGVCATPARYGVTVYMVIGLPPLAGAVQLTVAD